MQKNAQNQIIAKNTHTTNQGLSKELSVIVHVMRMSKTWKSRNEF